MTISILVKCPASAVDCKPALLAASDHGIAPIECVYQVAKWDECVLHTTDVNLARVQKWFTKDASVCLHYSII